MPLLNYITFKKYISAFDQENFADTPDSIECSIGHELMIAPVFAADGYTYDRKNIISHIQASTGKTLTSPRTGEAMVHDQVISDELMLEHLCNFQREYNILSYAEFINAISQGDLCLLQEKYFPDDYLAYFGVDNQQDKQALHLIVENNQAMVLSYLLNELDATAINYTTSKTKDEQRMTPLDLALITAHYECIEVLIKNHHKPDHLNSFMPCVGQTLLEWAVNRDAIGIIKILASLQNEGVNLDTPFSDGETTLFHYAKKNDKTEILELLSNHGFNSAAYESLESTINIDTLTDESIATSTSTYATETTRPALNPAIFSVAPERSQSPNTLTSTICGNTLIITGGIWDLNDPDTRHKYETRSRGRTVTFSGNAVVLYPGGSKVGNLETMMRLNLFPGGNNN